MAFRKRAGPAGLHLFDRTSGLNILLDQVRLPETTWHRAPRQVSIALTNSCDLDCSYCYAPKERARLPLESLIRWLDELDRHGCMGVGFGGGEPTLYRHLVDVCRYAAQNTGLAVTMTTHANRLHDRLLSELDGILHFVRVSMDGVGETYETLRGRSFIGLLDRIDAIGQVVPFGINFVVNTSTIRDLDTALTIASSKGAREFLLLPEQSVNGSGGIDPETSRSMREWIAGYRGAVPLTISEAGADGLPTCQPLSTEPSLRSYAHVTASGVLMANSYGDSGIRIGSGSIMSALATLEILSTTPTHRIGGYT